MTIPVKSCIASLPARTTTSQTTDRDRGLSSTQFLHQLGITTSIKKAPPPNCSPAAMTLRQGAGRLGHGGGGTTALKVYATWVSAADQRAALIMLDRMPARPVPGSPIGGGFAAGDEPDEIDPQRDYELIARTST